MVLWIFAMRMKYSFQPENLVLFIPTDLWVNHIQLAVTPVWKIWTLLIHIRATCPTVSSLRAQACRRQLEPVYVTIRIRLKVRKVDRKAKIAWVNRFAYKMNAHRILKKYARMFGEKEAQPQGRAHHCRPLQWEPASIMAWQTGASPAVITTNAAIAMWRKSVCSAVVHLLLLFGTTLRIHLFLGKHALGPRSEEKAARISYPVAAEE